MIFEEIDPAEAPLVAITTYGTRLHASVEVLLGGVWWTVRRDVSRAHHDPDPQMRDAYGGTHLWRLRDGKGVRWRVNVDQKPTYVSGHLAEEGPAEDGVADV